MTCEDISAAVSRPIVSRAAHDVEIVEERAPRPTDQKSAGPGDRAPASGAIGAAESSDRGVASMPAEEAGAGPGNRDALPERGKPARVSNFQAPDAANSVAREGSGAGGRRGSGSGYGDIPPRADEEVRFGHVKIDADTALVELYGRLVARAAPKDGSFSALDPDARRAYFLSLIHI